MGNPKRHTVTTGSTEIVPPVDGTYGRTLELARIDGERRLTVRAPGGAIELEVRFTAAGPMVAVRAASLEVETSDDVRIACRALRVDARESISLTAGSSGTPISEVGVSDRGIRIASQAEVDVVGEYINLN